MGDVDDSHAAERDKDDAVKVRNWVAKNCRLKRAGKHTDKRRRRKHKGHDDVDSEDAKRQTVRGDAGSG